MQFRSFQLREGDWLITICLQGNSNGWVFYCLPPDGEALTNNESYLDLEGAIAAAKRFIDRSLIRLELGKWLDALKDGDRISSDEYADALHLICRLMRE